MEQAVFKRAAYKKFPNQQKTRTICDEMIRALGEGFTAVNR